LPQVPDYLSYYFRRGQPPFEVLSDLHVDVAQRILANDTSWRGDGTYLEHRKRHEKLIRELFVEKGGRPKRRYPIYAILGESPTGPHDLENEYDYKIRIPLDIFPRGSASFTYPDSLYEVPFDDLGRVNLARNQAPTIYTMDDLARVICTYRVYAYNNHYIEAQIWDDEPLAPFSAPQRWIRCTRRWGRNDIHHC
jgi:hypothetical protein